MVGRAGSLTSAQGCFYWFYQYGLWVAGVYVAQLYSWYHRGLVGLAHIHLCQAVFCVPLLNSMKSSCTLSR